MKVFCWIAISWEKMKGGEGKGGVWRLLHPSIFSFCPACGRDRGRRGGRSRRSGLFSLGLGYFDVVVLDRGGGGEGGGGEGSMPTPARNRILSSFHDISRGGGGKKRGGGRGMMA